MTWRLLFARGRARGRERARREKGAPRERLGTPAGYGTDSRRGSRSRAGRRRRGRWTRRWTRPSARRENVAEDARRPRPSPRPGSSAPGSGRARRPSIWVPPARRTRRRTTRPRCPPPRCPPPRCPPPGCPPPRCPPRRSRRRCRSRRGRRASWSRRSRDAIRQPRRGRRRASRLARCPLPRARRASWLGAVRLQGLGSRSRRARVRLARRLARAWTTTNGRAPTFGCQFLDAPLYTKVDRASKGTRAPRNRNGSRRNWRSRPRPTPPGRRSDPRRALERLSLRTRPRGRNGYDAHSRGRRRRSASAPRRDVRGARVGAGGASRVRAGTGFLPRADPVPRADRARLARVAPRLGIAFLLLALLLGGALVRAVVSARAGRARLFRPPARRPRTISSPTPRRARDARLSGRRGTPASIPAGTAPR